MANFHGHWPPRKEPDSSVAQRVIEEMKVDLESGQAQDQERREPIPMVRELLAQIKQEREWPGAKARRAPKGFYPPHPTMVENMLEQIRVIASAADSLGATPAALLAANPHLTADHTRSLAPFNPNDYAIEEHHHAHHHQFGHEAWPRRGIHWNRTTLPDPADYRNSEFTDTRMGKIGVTPVEMSQFYRHQPASQPNFGRDIEAIMTAAGKAISGQVQSVIGSHLRAALRQGYFRQQG